MRWSTCCLLLACATALAGCASMSPQASALHKAQYAWSGAIRWGDFDGARHLVGPDYREAHPASDLEMRRYEQIRISSYRDSGSSQNYEAGTAARDIQIGVINRHTTVRRMVEYRERWRWDPVAERWWLVSGLPDLWPAD